jgi:MFS family permease
MIIIAIILLVSIVIIVIGDRLIEGIGRKSDYDFSVKPNNYLVWSILAAAFCCLPTGVVAIIFSAKVDKEWCRGNKIHAYELSKKAKRFCWISLVVPICLLFLSFIFIGVLQAFGSSL